MDGNSALEILKTVRPDLIILDLMLPDIIGYEVARQYSMNIDSRHLPLNEVVDKVLDLSCDDYITKPFESIEYSQS